MWNQGNWQVFSAGSPPPYSQRGSCGTSRKEVLRHFSDEWIVSELPTIRPVVTSMRRHSAVAQDLSQLDATAFCPWCAHVR